MPIELLMPPPKTLATNAAKPAKITPVSTAAPFVLAKKSAIPCTSLEIPCTASSIPFVKSWNELLLPMAATILTTAVNPLVKTGITAEAIFMSVVMTVEKVEITLSQLILLPISAKAFDATLTRFPKAAPNPPAISLSLNFLTTF